MPELPQVGFDVIHGDFRYGVGHKLAYDRVLMRLDDQEYLEKIPFDQIRTVVLGTPDQIQHYGGDEWLAPPPIETNPVVVFAQVFSKFRVTNKSVKFVCVFKDGRKFLGEAPRTTVNRFLSIPLTPENEPSKESA